MNFSSRDLGGWEWRNAALLALVALVLVGCSTVRIAYNNVDLYLLWKADDYFELDSGQKAQLKAGLDAIAQWHRSEELAEYTAVLLEARERVGAGIGAADLDWLLACARLRYEALARRAAPHAAQVLSSLSPAQIARFEATLQRENEAFAAEHVDLSPDAQRRKRFKRTLELLGEWVGPLTETQRVQMERLSFDIPLTNALRHADRQRRQQALLALLMEHRSPEALAPALEAWMID